MFMYNFDSLVYFFIVITDEKTFVGAAIAIVLIPSTITVIIEINGAMECIAVYVFKNNENIYILQNFDIIYLCLIQKSVD